jgi:Superinfection immunity protein
VSAAIFVAFCFFMYFLPAIVGRKKQNAGAIFALNFFLGWTVIGWVVSLVWALTVDNGSPARA